MTAQPQIEDVEANRSGMLSERQRGWLQKARRSKLLSSLGVFGIGAALLAIGLLDKNLSGPEFFIMIGLVVALYGIVIGAQNWRKFSADLAPGQIKTISGYTHVVRGSRQNETWMVIGTHRFAVAPRTAQNFTSGQYRAYYAPHSTMLLSLEALES